MSVITFELEKPVEEQLDNVVSRFNRVVASCYRLADQKKTQKEKADANRK